MSVSKMIKIAGIVAVSFEGTEALRLKGQRAQPKYRRIVKAAIIAAALSSGVAATPTRQDYNNAADQDTLNFLKTFAPLPLKTGGLIDDNTTLEEYQRMVEQAAVGFKNANKFHWNEIET